jgi:hypothetical protein
MKFISPRIHNLGDFANCLPALSGFYKKFNVKISLSICDRLQRFKGIKDLLLQQEMFYEVNFMCESNIPSNYILIDDTGSDEKTENTPLATARYANFIKQKYNLIFEVDEDFDLNVPRIDMPYFEDHILVGDRWSASEAPDVDARRYSHMIQQSGKLDKKQTLYLDYTKDLLYNCSLIKYNPNVFVTTFTGIGILADLMNKNQYITWGEDVRNWDNKPIQYSFDLHYFKNRSSKLIHINDLNIQ